MAGADGAACAAPNEKAGAESGVELVLAVVGAWVGLNEKAGADGGGVELLLTVDCVAPKGGAVAPNEKAAAEDAVELVYADDEAAKGGGGVACVASEKEERLAPK